jgi:hypothetical protein
VLVAVNGKITKSIQQNETLVNQTSRYSTNSRQHLTVKVIRISNLGSGSG